MCIIAAKPTGVQPPDASTLRKMWDANSDGAGFMYNMNGKVNIQKGLMTFEDFTKAWNKLSKSVDMKKTAIVLHFRITTHGGTKPENCHPFPISDNVEVLKRLHITTDLGVAHNGIIDSVIPRKDISDTMEYIATQLAPLKKALPRFYENKHAMLMVKNAIDSKMAFLTGDGKIYTIGDFINSNGMLYSNSTYLYDFRHFAWSRWDDDGYTDLSTTGAYKGTYKSTTPIVTKDTKATKGKTIARLFEDYPLRKELMFLDEEEYVYEDNAGEPFEVAYEEFLIDEDGAVYMFDWESDAAIFCPHAHAINAEGLPVRFEPDLAVPMYVDA